MPTLEAARSIPSHEFAMLAGGQGVPIEGPYDIARSRLLPGSLGQSQQVVSVDVGKAPFKVECGAVAAKHPEIAVTALARLFPWNFRGRQAYLRVAPCLA